MQRKAGVVYYNIINDKLYVLLVKSSNSKFGGPLFQLPKGCVDEKDSILFGAVREGCEETGVRDRDSSKYHYLNTFEIKDYLLTMFHCEIPCKIYGTPDFEISQRMWVEVSRALNIIRYEHKPILRSLKTRIKNLKKYKR